MRSKSEQAMDIENVLRRGIDAVSAAEDLRGLDEVRINYLGKKGGLTELLKGLGKLEPQERLSRQSICFNC